MRTFVDEQGTEWTAWEVRPGVGSLARPERRASDRRRESAPEPVVERRRGPDRRRRPERARTTLVPRTEAWLAFQAGTVRRRLVPIPATWEALSDVELRALCQTATPVARAMVAVD